MYKILIIEDDSVIAKAIKKKVDTWGYQAETVEDFENVMQKFAEFSPQLVLLDITLPFYNGFYWCSQIRKISKVPIIFISSHSDNMNIVMAMNMGGDDFIVKPFDFDVLTAKIQALLRRTYDFGNTMNIIEHNHLLLNCQDMTATYHETELILSKNEFRILQILMEHIGEVVSREDIMIALWNSESFIDDNTLTVNVTRLRKKLDSAGCTDFIKTKKRSGYLIV